MFCHRVQTLSEVQDGDTKHFRLCLASLIGLRTCRRGSTVIVWSCCDRRNAVPVVPSSRDAPDGNMKYGGYSVGDDVSVGGGEPGVRVRDLTPP